MTDAEKELRRLAQESLSDAKVWSGRALTEFQTEATPTAVLALLDRIEALEKQAQRADECERELKQWKMALRGP